MGFKEQLAEDMRVFFNPDEFAELHMINGAETLVIVDDEELAELYLRRETETDSLFTDSMLIFVQKSELNFEPVPKQYMDFDGEIYKITDVKFTDGMYAIVLGVNAH